MSKWLHQQSAESFGPPPEMLEDDDPTKESPAWYNLKKYLPANEDQNSEKEECIIY